ncbi:MAG TPA: VWA domain-containing protein [Candidatus Acidoferrum sp.]
MNRKAKSDLVAIALGLLFSLCLPVRLASQTGGAPEQGDSSAQPSATVTVPDRPVAPLYQGKPGTPESEVSFVPLSRTVTIKFQVQDPNGYFLPNIRRDNFAVYEDGVRQKNVSVEIEHAPVTVALVMEFGGRFHELNKTLASEIPPIGKGLLEVLGRNDKVAMFKYSDKLTPVADFNQSRESLDAVFDHLGVPESSETNFYDAVVDALQRMRDVQGRKAIILVTTGVDTFSKTSFDQLLQEVRTVGIPIYVIGLSHLVRREAAVLGNTAPFARIDWNTAEKQLESLAQASGGRAYLLQTEVEVPAIYDDIMENLRIRYVITYVSSNPSTGGPPRNIRVELVDPKTGRPLKIHDANGKVVSARVFVQQTYTPKVTTSKLVRASPVGIS